MQKLQWLLVRWSERLGVVSMAALALALFGLLYAPVALWPAQQRLDDLGKLAGQAHGAKATTILDESPVSTFLTAFPHTDALSGELQTLFDLAEQNGLDLGEVSYKQDRRQDERIEHYHVDFTVDAPYTDTRAFLSDALAELHYASLDQLSFTRENAQAESVQTRVRLTLHLVR